jgi:dolichyl-diphosphooligosaccharide--protein glycosyltransferase/undecaprenyl-diphosphooligosaccharide--protein glycosyltransferase
MFSTSPQLVANLSRLAVETYSKGAESAKEYSKGNRDTDDIPNEFKMYNKDGDAYHAGGGSVIDILLRNNQEDQKDHDIFISNLTSKDFKLPPKTRDIYLYLPYRMLNIFPTVSLFGNLDLNTGKKIGDIAFYPTTISKQDSGGMLILANGFNFDLKKGLLYYNNKPIKVKTLAITEYQGGKLKKVIQNYHRDGTLSIVFMKSYKKFIIMDNQAFQSTFVQMFMLENYDKNLFELVIASPYSKIYKLKK